MLPNDADDCEVWENELFGQDAHNMVLVILMVMAFAVAWALFPHTVKKIRN